MTPTPTDGTRCDLDGGRDPYRFDLDADPGFRPEGDPARRSDRLWLAVPLLLVGALIALGPVPAERDDGDTPAAVEDRYVADTDQTRVVPFRMLPSNHMVVQARLNGKGPYRLIFDLGSPVTILSNRAAEGSGAIPDDAPKSFLFGTRGEGTIETMELGELTAEDVPVVVMDHPALEALGGILSRPLDGIVGYTFFARYRTTIDYQTRQMTFTPVDFEVRDLLAELPQRVLGPKVTRTRILAPEGLWGLVLGEPTGDLDSPGVPIAAVLPGSPAAHAGLEPGDILTTLDGRWVASVADAYAAAAAARVGSPVEAVVLRDGAERTLAVTPVPGI